MERTQNTYSEVFLIHEADPQSQPVIITIFARGVRPSVGRYFSKYLKTKQLSQ